MSNPTEEQVEAGAKALACLCPEDWAVLSDRSRNHARREARAVLVAAAGAAPQAESDDCPTPGNHATEEALDHLESLRYKGTVEYADYVALHDLISAITPVLPSSTVDEGKIAEVVREAKTSWLRACGTPGHVEEIDVWITRAVVEAIGGESR